MAVNPDRLPARIPDPEDLLALDREELLRLMEFFGIDLDVVKLEAAADAATSRLIDAIRSGVTLDSAAIARLDTSVQQAFDNALRAEIKTVVRDWRLERLSTVVAGMADGEAALPLMWVAIMDSNTCESCEPRHGMERTMVEWQAIGLPGSPALVCANQCRCELLPMPAEDAPSVFVELAKL